MSSEYSSGTPRDAGAATMPMAMRTTTRRAGAGRTAGAAKKAAGRATKA